MDINPPGYNPMKYSAFNRSYMLERPSNYISNTIYGIIFFLAAALSIAIAGLILVKTAPAFPPTVACKIFSQLADADNTTYFVPYTVHWHNVSYDTNGMFSFSNDTIMTIPYGYGGVWTFSATILLLPISSMTTPIFAFAFAINGQSPLGQQDLSKLGMAASVAPVLAGTVNVRTISGTAILNSGDQVSIELLSSDPVTVDGVAMVANLLSQ